MNQPPSALADLTIYYLYDYGTKNAVVGVSINSNEQDKQVQGATTILRLQDNESETPQAVGYVRRDDGSLVFIFGHELVQVLSSPVAHTVVAWWDKLKLAILGAAEGDLAYRKSIEDDLTLLDVPEMDADDLFVRHLVAMKEAVFDATLIEFPQEYTEEELRQMPVRCLIAVPDIAAPHRRVRLMELIRRAQFPPTTAISETEAAGAWHAHKYCQRAANSSMLRRLFTHGLEFIVVDLGGWTGNFASYTVIGSPRDGARIAMKSTGKTDSQPYGSEMITQRFTKHVRDVLRIKYNKPLREVLAQLGLTRSALDRALSRDFDGYKANFSKEGERIFAVKGTGKDRHHVTITALQMKTWIEGAEVLISDLAESFITSSTKTIFFTGGFSRCTYMLDLLRERYKGRGITVIDDGKDENGSADNSVARGGIARFAIGTTPSPFPYALVIPQDEYWDAEQHPDIPKGSQEIQFHPSSSGGGGSDHWIPDRACTILPKGVLASSQQQTTRTTILEILLDEENFEYEKSIYWTKAEIEDHEPLLRGGELRPDIGVWSNIGFRLTEEQVKQHTPVVHDAPTRDSRSSEVITQRQLTLVFFTTTDSMNCDIELAMCPPSWNLYVYRYLDNGEVVRGRANPGRKTAQQLNDLPRHEDMVHLAGADLVMANYYTELQRREVSENETMD